jgi:hypothetical protein
MSVFDLSSGALNTAGSTLAGTVAPGAIASSMNTYMSPYINRVLDDSVARLRDRKAIDLNQNNANALASGAFGGSRHGVVDAQLMDDYGRSEDELVARLLQQGFDTSAGLATTELGLQQSGAQGLMGLGSTAFGIGQQVNAGQMQAGGMQQQLLQALLGGASDQYETYSNYPTKQLSTLLSAISGNPLAGNVSQTYKPGLFDYLGMGSGVLTAGK